MSKTIYDVTLLELIPENLRNDPDIIAASKSVDNSFSPIIQSTNKCLTFADIDNVEEKILDLLAAEMNADFYDQTLPVENKRDIVKNAYIYHFLKGTPYAVEQLISNIFGGQAKLVEWFEYGGAPYTFKVIVQNTDITGELAEKFTKAVNSVKNIRSHMDGLIIGYVCSNDIFCDDNLIII